MKFLIAYDLIDLVKSTLAKCIITEYPLLIFNNTAVSSLKLFKIHQDASIMATNVLLKNGKACFEDGLSYTIEEISLDKIHLIVFEPTLKFGDILVGRAMEINPDDENTIQDHAFLLLSEEKGPSSYTTCTLTNGELDCGQNCLIKVVDSRV